MARRLFYYFGPKGAEGSGKLKDELGGKGAGLAEMCRSGIPVPPGFTISTEACRQFMRRGGKVSTRVENVTKVYLAWLEKETDRRLGDPERPLLVSVRSGAKFSMPGMMDTILNLGLNDRTVEGLARQTGDVRFAYDCYRRFIMMFSDVVMGVDKKLFEEILHARKRERGMKEDLELGGEDMKFLAARFLEFYRERVGKPFPQDPYEQLRAARDAVFRSWLNPRAKAYRRMNAIPDDLGTAVNIQSMVFGNLGRASGTGVGFTRDPGTGEKRLYGEFLQNAQGEDVVAGVRTPLPISRLAEEMPEVYAQLEKIAERLERHYRDVQDFEFTVQDGRLYMLQTRSGKRTGHAAVKIAVDLVREKRVKPRDALLLVEPAHMEQLLHPAFDPVARREFDVITKGLNASPGAAAGKAVFDPERAVERSRKGERVILVRAETSPDDISGMAVSQGFLTATGGMTSHAAVVGRGMGKPAVVGAKAIAVDEHGRKFKVGDLEVCEGDEISLDGYTGEVLYGAVPLRDAEILRVVRGEMKPEESEVWGYYEQVMQWADEARRLGVRANADTPEDAALAVRFGAEGIGLTRTEHMFFGTRLPAMQEMIVAETPPARKKALEKIAQYQEDDFYGIFKALDGRPATIRTLDPPLHEFLPRESADPLWARRAKELEEVNPMLGHRGCRLGITHPEITEMQAKAILGAACRLAKEGRKVRPEIMIPLVGNPEELEHQLVVVRKAAEEVFARYGEKVPFLLGTMIEVPRAALISGRIAEQAEFFSFGTNDLTQTTLGFSRDDAGKFLGAYLDLGILRDDPFATVDTEGVGRLMRLSVEEGRKVRPKLKVGICGEHGGDPRSIEFCETIGLDYVSCSPYRIPVARLAAARAALKAQAAG